MKRKLIAVLLAAAMTVSLAACGGGESGGAGTESGTAGEAGGEPYTVTMVLNGTQQLDEERIEAKVNEILEKELNARLDLVVLPWASASQQLQLMLAGDEKIDIFYTNATSAVQYMHSGQIMDMAGLLDQYGTNLKEIFGEDTLKGNSVDGFLYGVPTQIERGSIPAIFMRKDLVEKYGIDTSAIKEPKDLEPVFEKVQAGEPDMTMLFSINEGDTPITRVFGGDTLADSNILGALIDPENSTTIENFYASDWYKETTTMLYDWYKKGYISQDAGTNTENWRTVFKAGNMFSLFFAYHPGTPVEFESSTGYEFEIVPFREYPVKMAQSYNSVIFSVAQNSENPSKAMEVLDYIYGSPEVMMNDSGMPYSVKKKWNIITSGGETYMCKIAQNQGVYLGCYVNVKSILEPFSNIIMGKNGYVCLVNEQGENVGMLTSHGISEKNVEAKETDKYSIEKQLSQAPFSIRMKISGERIWDVVMGSVAVLATLAAMLIASGIVIFIYLKRNILEPVQRFTRKLEQYDSGEYALNLTEESLLELERIDDKFKNMIHQIRRLKITLYEQALEKQKVEMDFLKLQIRPHFYLNCLNFIYSMIDFRQYDSARRMSKITADYLTYIFRNTSERVPVTAETLHCQNYLDILLLRYPGSFEGYVEVHEEVRDAEIFPFLIQVFVENAAKHALTLEEKILISVTVYPEDREEGTYVNIYISDTGDGFAPDVLERLQRGEGISDGGHHVGIANCLKRFKL